MLALIAGGGGLPQRVAGALADAPLICAYEGTTPVGLEPDLVFRLETLGTLLAELTARDVTQVCFCGAVARPSFDPSKLDAATLPLVPVFQKALAAGDDGALRALVDIFQTAGLTVVAAHDLAPDLMAREGVLSQRQPEAQMRDDAARGAALVRCLAPMDVGQCCVVGQGQVMGIEAIGGTDHLLSTLPDRARAASAVLFKGPKPGQSHLVDMPTIGPDTLRRAHAAGLAGVVI